MVLPLRRKTAQAPRVLLELTWNVMKEMRLGLDAVRHQRQELLVELRAHISQATRVPSGDVTSCEDIHHFCCGTKQCRVVWQRSNRLKNELTQQLQYQQTRESLSSERPDVRPEGLVDAIPGEPRLDLRVAKWQLHLLLELVDLCKGDASLFDGYAKLVSQVLEHTA